MITSFEVGAVFKILDEASPALRKMLASVRALSKAIKEVRAQLDGLAKVPGLAAAIDETKALGTAWAKVSEDAGAATKSIRAATRAAASARRDVAPVIAGIESGAFPRIGRGGAAPHIGHGGGGGFGGIGARFGGGGHFGGGSFHARFGGHGLAMGAAGLLGYGVYEEAKMQDAIFQLLYHSGLAGTTANRKKFRDIIQTAMSRSGYGLDAIADAAKNEVRMFKGTPGGGIDVLPEMLKAATIEARLKGTSPRESMTALIGLAHMTKQYSPQAIKKLAPGFAFLSASNPASLGSMEKAASYAVPILQSGLNIDPMTSLLLGTVLTRAGATNSKSGTWLRNLFLNALPGTSLMSDKAFKKHEAALKALGLVDSHENPTWFTDGKPDPFKLLEIGSAHAAKIPLIKRAAYEKQLFGTQGFGAFALLADPAIRQQVQALNAERQSPAFKNRYATFMQDYNAQSPVQKFRTTLADFNNVMMNLGSTVLPSLTSALKDVDTTLKTFRSILPSSPGGPAAKSAQWNIGAKMLEGAAVGAAGGSLLGVATVPGAIIGGATLGVYSWVHNLITGYKKSGTTADQSASQVNKLTGAINALGTAAGTAAGAVGSAGPLHKMDFLSGPKKTGQPVVIHTALHLGGRKFAQATSEVLADLYRYPTQAPFFEGRGEHTPPDMQYINT